MADITKMTVPELEAENEKLSARKEVEGRTPAIREAQLAIAQQINLRLAAAKLDDALAGLSPENREAVLAAAREG